jgi:hypothetical protein
MLKGVHLTLMIGPTVPVPVPQAILDALTSVQVNCYSGENPSGFELTFTLSNRSPLHTLFLISGGSFTPFVRVVIIATVNGIPEVLMDGIMTHHKVEPDQDGRSRLTVMGKDLTALMEIIPFNGIPYPALPTYARINLILAKYMAFGIVPAVVPPILINIPLPTEQIPRHIGTDLDYIRLLASQAGYIFYISPGPAPLTSIAYWGPEVRVGMPQPALNVNMDAHTNVESLSFSLDKEAKETPIVWLQLPVVKVPFPVPIPDITPLNPPLGLVPPLPPKVTWLDDTAMLPAIEAALQGVAYAAQHADSVTGTGSLDVTRYGRILKARQLIGVRGAGPAFDGLYYVKSVTHTIKPGEYKQSFTLSRNGVLSTVPVVPA